MDISGDSTTITSCSLYEWCATPRRVHIARWRAFIAAKSLLTERVREKAPGLSDGWVFPSEVGTLRTPGSLWKAWQGCIEAIGFTRRFTVHGLRRTFNDLARRAGADGIVIRSLTGHVTEKMREHYSTVALDEKRQTAADVVQLVGASPAPSPQSPASEGSGTRWSNLEID